jgi:hypothetical protein
MEIEDLLKLANGIVQLYLIMEASEHARSSNNVGSRNEFVRGAPWKNVSVNRQDASMSMGNQVLANTIL